MPNCIKELHLRPVETIPGLPDTIGMLCLCDQGFLKIVSEPLVYKDVKCNHQVYKLVFCVKSDVFGKSTSTSDFHSDNSYIFIIRFYHLKLFRL